VDLLRQIATPKKPKDMRKYLPRARYGDFRAAEAAARGSPAMTEPAGPMARNQMALAAAQGALGVAAAAHTDPSPGMEDLSQIAGGHMKPAAPRFDMRRRPGASPKQIKIGSRHDEEGREGVNYLPGSHFDARPERSTRRDPGHREQGHGSHRGDPTHRSRREQGTHRSSKRGGARGGQGEEGPTSGLDPLRGKKHYFPGLSQNHRGSGGQRAPRSLAGRAAAGMYGFDEEGHRGPPGYREETDRYGPGGGGGVSNRSYRPEPSQRSRFAAPSSSQRPDWHGGAGPSDRVLDRGIVPTERSYRQDGAPGGGGQDRMDRRERQPRLAPQPQGREVQAPQAPPEREDLQGDSLGGGGAGSDETAGPGMRISGVKAHPRQQQPAEMPVASSAGHGEREAPPIESHQERRAIPRPTHEHPDSFGLDDRPPDKAEGGGGGRKRGGGKQQQASGELAAEPTGGGFLPPVGGAQGGSLGGAQLNHDEGFVAPPSGAAVDSGIVTPPGAQD